MRKRMRMVFVFLVHTGAYLPFVCWCRLDQIIAVDDLKDTAPAILEAFMPGVHGGAAIADTVFGDNNPGYVRAPTRVAA